MKVIGFPDISGLGPGIVLVLIGILILIFPKIINYLIAAAMILAGIGWLAGGNPLVGIVSILFGIVVFIFPTILNYIVAAYLVLIGIWLLINSAVIVGLISLLAGIIVLFGARNPEHFIRDLLASNRGDSHRALLRLVLIKKERI